MNISVQNSQDLQNIGDRNENVKAWAEQGAVEAMEREWSLRNCNIMRSVCPDPQGSSREELVVAALARGRLLQCEVRAMGEAQTPPKESEALCSVDHNNRRNGMDQSWR